MEQHMYTVNVWLACIQAATFLALIVYVVKTWHIASATRDSAGASQRMIDEMVETRRQESAPHVITYFDVPYGTQWIYLVVKNVGKTVAKDVGLLFEPALLTSSGADLQHVPLMRDGVASIPPGYEIRTFFDSMISYFEDDSLPLSYSGTVTFNGCADDRPGRTHQVLDLSAYRGLHLLHEKGTHELVGQVERLVQASSQSSRHLESLVERLGAGMWLRSLAGIPIDLSTQPAEWRALANAKLHELRCVWLAVSQGSAVDSANRLSDLQTMLGILGQQMLTLASTRPEDVDREASDRLCALAASMFDMAYRTRHLMRGGGSRKSFAEMGDHALALATEVTEMLSAGTPHGQDN